MQTRATGGVWIVLAALACVVLQPEVRAGAARQAGVNPQAAALAEFNKRIEAYMTVRQKAVSAFQPLKEDADPAAIADREKALGEAIRTARTGASRGDVFTSEVARVFRRAIKADFQRRSTHGKRLVLDEMPHFRPVVNQTYPSTWPLATFPPTLLAELPRLPAELEYRFVGDALILRDTKANVVVDFILDVM